MPAFRVKGTPASRSHVAHAALQLTLPALVLALALPSRSAAAAPPQVAPPGFFGIAEPVVQPNDFGQMHDAGAGALRLQFLLGDAKKGKGQAYDWSYFDYLVRGAANNGLDLVPVLYGVPPWISKDRASVPLGGKAVEAEWAKFLAALVQRYGPAGAFWTLPENEYTPFHPITVWQVWNEPNSITWWEPRPDPRKYALLLRRSADIIHATDPNAQIMSAGIVAHPTNAHAIPGNRFVKRMLKTPGTVDAMDIFAFHPYAPSVGSAIRQIKSVRRVLNRGGASAAPIWVTEIGWGSKGKVSLPLIKTPEDQERSLVQLMNSVLAIHEKFGVGRMFWYHWRDAPDNLCRWCKTSGLLNRRSHPKSLLSLFRGIATNVAPASAAQLDSVR
jgi:hypothetical protein